MRCHKVRAQLYEYLSGSLAPRQQRAIETHLGRCETCRKEMESFQALDARLRQGIPLIWESVIPLSGFEARLKRAIPPAPERPSRIADRLMLLWQNHPRALAAGITACIILALAISLPLTLIDGGTGPEMIAQDSGGQVPATSRYPSTESEEFARKMAAPAAESAPDGTPAPAPTTPPQAETINGDISLSGTWGLAMGESTGAPPEKGVIVAEEMILAKEQELAIWVAFSDPRIKGLLRSKTLLAIEVPQGAAFGDFECPGPTIVLTLQNSDGAETLLYACVNPDNHSVSRISVVSE